MDASLVPVFIFIFLSKANNHNPNTIFRDQPFMDMDLKAVNDESQSSHLSADDKKKILNYLMSFTNSLQQSQPAKKITQRDYVVVTQRNQGDASKYCNSFRTCKECSKSKWNPCIWCHNYGCTDRPEKLCPYAMTKKELVAANSSKDLSVLCPYIEHQGTIVVPAGVRYNLQVKIHVADPVLYEKEILCQLKFSNRLSHLRAWIFDDHVYCYHVKLDITIQGKSNIGYLRLIWGGIQPFSNKIPVAVYKCELLASDCENCRMLPPEYGCGWCGVTNMCVMADKCANLQSWKLNKLTCKSLKKKMFYV